MSHIELLNVSKSYDKAHNVLSEIDVSIQKGEFFVLVGPSGSGKSTLLRMIAGLEEITDGAIHMNGQAVHHLPPKDRHLSMVFQNYALYPHLTVEQNILFGLNAKRVDKQQQKKRLSETADMMGLAELLKRKPRQLSGGQRQRVALARSVVSEAPICLMDEPLSNLDAKLRAHMRMEIRRLQKKLGLTMVYVTHDQVEAMTMGDRIMVLHDGAIQQIGDPLTLYNEPANLFVASFIGSPKMNMGSAVVKNHHIVIEEALSLPVEAADVMELSKNRRLTAGIRAEHLVRGEAGDGAHELPVVNVEQLGNETLVTFEVGREFWTAKWLGQHTVRIGERIPVRLSVKNVSFFDTDTGELLKAAASPAAREGVAI